MHQNTTDDLSSECGLDYHRLRDLLAVGEWKEADRETADKMLAVIGKESWWEVRREHIEKFPCTDLRTIDRLWVTYSNGRFGFSVQKRILQSVGGQPGVWDYDIYEKFGDIVGWREQKEWKEWKEWKNSLELTFNLNAPQGHLPMVVGGWETWGIGWGLGGPFGCIYTEDDIWHWGGLKLYLFSRVETCRM